MLFLTVFFISLHYHFFYSIYTAEELIIPYGLKPFDICSKNPILWKYIKITHIASFAFSIIIITNLFFSKLFKKFFKLEKIKSKNQKQNSIGSTKFRNSTNPCNRLQLLVGFDETSKSNIYIPESGLYQNFLITGTIGSGKTSSAMYPFTEQILKFNSQHSNQKIAMLILDVKGNYYSQVKEFCKTYNLLSDLIVIELHSHIHYNPLHKPHLKPQVLANRLKTILLLFSENNSESYWLDKAEQVLTECIKLCRFYNHGYVTFLELHKLITIPNYYQEKIPILKERFMNGKLKKQEIYELNACLDFFQKEFETLDQRTKAILISEITRITNTFVSDYDVMSCFCSPKEKLTFTGFEEVIKKGKIVVLNMNISEYANLSKMIATYLKLDFQTEILTNLSNHHIYPTAFICDEYDKYASKTDAEFFSLSREAKCINIVSTQSYSSLKNTLKDDSFVKVIVQNLINKIWFRTDDIFTIEEAQKQLGKEEKTRISKSVSENAKETKFSYISNTLNSENSNISESISTYIQNDYIYESNYFTQKLETFYALCFLSDGTRIYPPCKLQMIPYFKNPKIFNVKK